MQFTDFTFIFIFLPAFLLLFYLSPAPIKPAIILLGSSAFYFWAEPLFFFVLLFIILLDFAFALLIAKTRTRALLSKGLLTLAILLNLAMLLLLRDVVNLTKIPGGTQSVAIVLSSLVLPVGISFISFSALSYLLDVAKGTILPTSDPFLFSNYILFFPKVQQGPIYSFQSFKKNISSIHISPDKLSGGISRFIGGLAKKVLIADSLAPVAESVFTANLTDIGFGLSWYGLIAFAIQIYFDFSGYTDMAISLAGLMGFSLPENFNSPYACVSVADFWRRWHMTLTAWFRKYVFFPLEFSLRRWGVFRQPINLMVVFFLTGAWHGLSPNFLIWGTYFGVILAVESLGLGRLLKRLPLVIQRFYALLLVLIGWVFFRLRTPSNWPLFFRALTGLNGLSADITARTLNILGYLPILLIGALLSFPIHTKSKLKEAPLFEVFLLFTKIGLFILSIAFLVEGGYQAFIYRQF